MSYAKISAFGSGVNASILANPLTYCAVSGLESQFDHPTGGTLFGPDSSQCQKFMSDYCSQSWDGVCEFASKNINNQFPNTLAKCDSPFSGSCGTSNGLKDAFSQGEMLIRNTAAKKYLSEMSANCTLAYEPFDPTTAASPLIGSWQSSHGKCVPRYEVDPSKIDNDPVMNKILQKPTIAADILINIYNTAKNKGALEGLRGTKLYNLFQTPWFKEIVGITKYISDTRL